MNFIKITTRLKKEVFINFENILTITIAPKTQVDKKFQSCITLVNSNKIMCYESVSQIIEDIRITEASGVAEAFALGHEAVKDISNTNHS